MNAICVIKLPIRKINLYWIEKNQKNECPYQCDQFRKKISKEHVLVTQQHVHKGVKPYNCSQCNRTISERSF